MKLWTFLLMFFYSINNFVPVCCTMQAFVKTAAKILQNIQEGVFDVSNEVCHLNLKTASYVLYLSSIRIKMWFCLYSPLGSKLAMEGLKVGRKKEQLFREVHAAAD